MLWCEQTSRICPQFYLQQNEEALIDYPVIIAILWFMFFLQARMERLLVFLCAYIINRYKCLVLLPYFLSDLPKYTFILKIKQVVLNDALDSWFSWFFWFFEKMSASMWINPDFQVLPSKNQGCCWRGICFDGVFYVWIQASTSAEKNGYRGNIQWVSWPHRWYLIDCRLAFIHYPLFDWGFATLAGQAAPKPAAVNVLVAGGSIFVPWKILVKRECARADSCIKDIKKTGRMVRLKRVVGVMASF